MSKQIVPRTSITHRQREDIQPVDFVEGEVVSEQRIIKKQKRTEEQHRTGLFKGLLVIVLGSVLLVCGFLTWRTLAVTKEMNAQPAYVSNQVNQYNTIQQGDAPDVTVVNYPDDGGDAFYLCGGAILFFLFLGVIISRN